MALEDQNLARNATDGGWLEQTVSVDVEAHIFLFPADRDLVGRRHALCRRGSRDDANADFLTVPESHDVQCRQAQINSLLERTQPDVSVWL